MTSFFNSVEHTAGDMVDSALATAGALYVTDRFVMPMMVEVAGPVESNGAKHLLLQTCGVVCANTIVQKASQYGYLPVIFGTQR